MSKFDTISACMIVRDEENHLPRCLSSIKSVVDEIIVVDTGSKDSTIKIAESFGAKVYVHPWEEDFSKHRNQSISYASKDWILIIDADEELVLGQGGLSMLKRCLNTTAQSKNGGHLAIAISLHDIQQGRVVMHQNTARLFRKGHIKYNGIVHNQPVMDSRATMIEESVMYINHYGYDLSPEEMNERKTSRTLPLVLKWLEKEPDNFHPHFYLVQIYMESGQPEKALKHGEIYLQNREKLENSGCQNFNKSIYYSMFSAYMKVGKLDDAERWLNEGLRHDPVNLDLAFALTQFGIVRNDQHLIYLGARQYVNLYDKMKTDPMARKNTFMFSCNPESYSYCLYSLALSQFKLGIDSMHRLKSIIFDTSDSLYKKGLLADLKNELFTIGLGEFADKNIVFEHSMVVPSLVEELMTKRPEIFHYKRNFKNGSALYATGKTDNHSASH